MKYGLLLVVLCLLNAIMLYPTTARSDDNKVKLSGQLRTRSELDGKDFNSDTTLNRFTLLRARLNATFQPADKISTFVQWQDSRAYGSENAPNPGTLTDTHNVDLHQAYVQVNDFFVDKLVLKMGRMELSYAEERLVGAVGWDNVGRAFDGTLLRYQTSKTFSADLWGTKLVAQADPKVTDDTGFYFCGLYTTYQPKETYRLDLYALGEWNRKQTVKDEDDLRRITVGTYDRGTLKPIDYEVEAAVQLGKRHNPTNKKRETVSALMLTGSLGYTLDISQKPRIAVGYDYLSGRGAEDEDYKVFDTLFATNHKFYGFMDYFLNIPLHTDGAGLIDLMAKFQLSPHKTLTLKADLHQFMSAKKVKSENNYGQEVDLTAIYRYYKALGFTLGASLFLPGELMKARFGGNDAPAFWSYLMTTANF